MYNYSSIDWNFITSKLATFSTSEIGRSLLLQTAPLKNAEQATDSMREIQEGIDLNKGGFRPSMQSLDLFETWFLRLTKGGVLKPLELRDVRHLCHEMIALRSLCGTVESHWAKKIYGQLMDAESALSAIDHLLSPDGEVRTDASETLYGLYQEKLQKSQQIQKELDQIVQKHQMENLLQDKYVTNREGRWVLPIKSGMQHSFSGIIHATSQTKQTVFMEPSEIIPINNRIREIEALIEKEIDTLLRQLSEYLVTFSDEWLKAKGTLIEADLNFSKAQLCVELNAEPCQFTESHLELLDLRHPVLVSKKEKVVANTVSLSSTDGILLLSGPNAGGKTVLLKSIGLAAHMARCGLLICARGTSKLPFLKNIFITVGDAQNVDLHLSTFAAHLKSLNEACTAKGSDSLLLIDEICGSTDPEEGSALARSFIEQFAKNQTFAIITSHLGPLKLGWDAGSGVVNGSLESDLESGTPTYRFIPGVAGQSLAIQTAKRVGVGKNIIVRAIALLSPLAQWQQKTQEEVTQLKDGLKAARQNYEKELKEVNATKNQYSKLIEKFKKERNVWLEKSIKKTEKVIDEMLSQAKVVQIFDRHEKLQNLKKDLPQIIGYNDPKSADVINSTEEFAKKCPPGTNVFIPSLNRSGIIQSPPNNSGEVFVLSQSMRVSVAWQQLQTSKAETPPPHRGFVFQQTLDSDTIIDLRGKRVDEAIQELEIALDSAVTKQEQRIKVIHGHGTETLKRTVRSYLSRNPSVKGWKAGGSEAGGDGVTWVEFI